MHTILILGGYGATGRPLTKHLLAQTDHEIIVAGRNLEKAQIFVRSMENPRVSARRVDATDPVSLREGLRGVDFLLVAAPTTHHTETVICAALEAGVDYLDVQLSDQKLQLLRKHERDFQQKNLCFITEAGFHP